PNKLGQPQMSVFSSDQTPDGTINEKIVKEKSEREFLTKIGSSVSVLKTLMIFLCVQVLFPRINVKFKEWKAKIPFLKQFCKNCMAASGPVCLNIFSCGVQAVAHRLNSFSQSLV